TSRHVLPAGIVEIQPVFETTPLIQTVYQLSIQDFTLRPHLPNVGECGSRKCHLDHEFMIVEGYGSGRIECDLFAFSLEFPGILRSAWVHVLNANMLRQLAGRLRHRPVPEIFRRADDYQAKTRPYFHCHHAFAEAFPKTNTCVKTF